MRFPTFYRLCILVLLIGLIGLFGHAKPEKSIIINEISWSGTQASWADEWIELKNTSNESVDLDGWTLSWEGVTIHLGEEKEDTLSLKTEIIGAGEVFLLERSDDQSVSTVRADIVYKGSLSNSGEKVLLKNSRGNIINSVNGKNGWMAGTTSGEDPSCASMELIDGKWKTSTDKGEQKDVEGNMIYGSPGKLGEGIE